MCLTRALQSNFPLCNWRCICLPEPWWQSHIRWHLVTSHRMGPAASTSQPRWLCGSTLSQKDHTATGFQEINHRALLTLGKSYLHLLISFQTSTALGITSVIKSCTKNISWAQLPWDFIWVPVPFSADRRCPSWEVFLSNSSCIVSSLYIQEAPDAYCAIGNWLSLFPDDTNRDRRK